MLQNSLQKFYQSTPLQKFFGSNAKNTSVLFSKKTTILTKADWKQRRKEKLEHFGRTWLGIEYNSKPFICKDAIKALDNLDIHILKGCIENIPPKTGTSKNDSLHRQLNNIINTPKGSVELIVSILGSFWEINATVHLPFVPKLFGKRKKILKHLELPYLSLKSRILK